MPKKPLKINEMNRDWVLRNDAVQKSIMRSTLDISHCLRTRDYSRLHEKLKSAMNDPAKAEEMYRLVFFEHFGITDGKQFAEFLDYLEENDLPFFRKISFGFLRYFSIFGDNKRIADYSFTEEFIKTVYSRAYYGGLVLDVTHILKNPDRTFDHLYQLFNSARYWGIPKSEVQASIKLFMQKKILPEHFAKKLLTALKLTG